MNTLNKIIDIDLEFEGVEFNEQEIRKHTQYTKSSLSHTGQKRSDQAIANMSNAQKGKPKNESTKTKISDAMRGKTLEDILGEDRATEGRQRRSELLKGKKRPAEVGQKIAATRRANGSYEHNGMTGKAHKESTKEMQSIKAQIRQDLKRQLGLGRNDKIPKELLEQEYEKLALNSTGIEK